MAQRSGRTLSQMVIERRVKKVTSIGHSSSRTRPTNKHKRRSYKKYRGQGK